MEPTAMRRLERWELFLLAAGAILVALLVTVAVVPPRPPTLAERQDALTTVAPLVGAVVLGLNLVFTGRTVENPRRALDHAQENQKAERFFKASEQLGDKDSEDVRIAALYSLERLANDSPDYYNQVIWVICAFVRRR